MVQTFTGFDGLDLESFADDTRPAPEIKQDMKELMKELLVDDPCPECGSTDIYHTGADVICKQCGTVIDESLPENRPDWRVFKEEDKTRIHAEKVRDDRGLTTVIDSRGKDYAGRNLDPEMNCKMRRLAKTDTRQKETKEERNVRNAMNQIRLFCSKMSFGEQIKRDSVVFFKKYVKNSLGGSLKGKSINDLIVTIVYKACKDARVPFKIEEMARMMEIDPKRIRGYYVEIMQNVPEKSCGATPVDYIPRFASKLKVNGETEVTAIRLMNDVLKRDENGAMVMGKQASGYAAAAVYLAAIVTGEQPIRNRETVSRYTGIAESTIKKRGEEIIDLLELDINDYFTRNYKRFVDRHKNRFKK